MGLLEQNYKNKEITDEFEPALPFLNDSAERSTGSEMIHPCNENSPDDGEGTIVTTMRPNSRKD
jgi:hypothetical protein